MKILGFNRVELVVREDQIDQAVQQFNELLGLHLPKPFAVEGHPVLSSTDFDGHVEFVAPINGEGPFGAKLASKGAGQIGPLVWEIADIDEAKARLAERGFRISFEYIATARDTGDKPHVHQLVLDPEQWFGFGITLMKRTPKTPA